MDDRIAERFWSRVDKIDLTGCWLWDGYINKNRYGTWSYSQGGKTKTVSAHRAAYELLRGPIPDGLVLDHLCRVRFCCNPDHLVPVTQKQNLARSKSGQTGAERNRAKTHCLQGHSYSGDNLHITPDGKRVCRACARRYTAEARARRLATNPPEPRKRQEACKRGHAFTPENTAVDSSGRRRCRECSRARVREYRAREDKQVVHRVSVCKNGHELDEANSSYSADGARSCRACNREKVRALYQRTQGHRGPAPAERTHCPEGHAYDEVNTYVTSKGHRQCRTCNKAREVARTEKRRAERASA